MLIGDVDSDPFISRPPPPTLPIDYSYPSLFFESMSLSLAHPKLNFLEQRVLFGRMCYEQN